MCSADTIGLRFTGDYSLHDSVPWLPEPRS